MADKSNDGRTITGKKDPLPSTRDKSPPKSAFMNEMATIKVSTGKMERTFHAHRGLLSFYSGYFKAALDGRFAEAQSGVLELEIEEPDVFEEFLDVA